MMATLTMLLPSVERLQARNTMLLSSKSDNLFIIHARRNNSTQR